MRFGGIALLGALAGCLLVTQAAFAANPVTVVLAAAATPAGSSQRCVSVTTTDSVTNQPLAADVQLIVSSPPRSESLQAKTDFSGKGTLCFDQLVGNQGASVTLAANTTVLVHSSPDYPAAATSNTTTVSWGTSVLSSQVGQMAISPTAKTDSVAIGEPDVVDIKVVYTGTSANSPTLQVAFSGVQPSSVSVTSDSGSCTGAAPVSCSFANLVNGGQANVELTIEAASAGQLTLGLSARWSTPLPLVGGGTGPSLSGSATGQLGLTVTDPVADISVALGAAGPRQTLGKPNSVVAFVSDRGPQPVANATLSFVLPKTIRLLRVVGVGFSCRLATSVCAVTGLTPGGSRRLVLVVIPTKAGRIPVTARVAAPGTSDPVAANNTAARTLVVP